MKVPLLVIVGPTAVGKTKISIELAKRLNGEIISGDSVQVYKGMDIGSAKITPTEMEGIPHHLIDILNADAQYTVMDFKKEAQQIIEDIYSRGKIPMIVGGTGLYIQSLLYEYEFRYEDTELKKQWTTYYEAFPKEELFNELSRLDSISSGTIHPNNYKRLIRALVYFKMHGSSIATQSKSQTMTSKYDTLLVGLTMPRTLLYERINKRVDIMINAGLVNEVRQLMNLGFKNCNSMSAIGYKEIIPYIEGKTTLDDATSALKQHSRKFAKRQMTWFNNQMEVNWFDARRPMNELVEDIMTQFKEI